MEAATKERKTTKNRETMLSEKGWKKKKNKEGQR